MDQGAKSVRFRHDVPKSKGPAMEIVRLIGCERQQVICLSPRLWGVDVHWDPEKRRTSHCLGEDRDCPGCIAQLPTKFRGYLCFENTSRRIRWIELTEDCALELEAITIGEKSLRGLVFNFRRTNSHKGRLYVEREAYTRDPKNLAPDHDPAEILYFLWTYSKYKKNASRNGSD